MSLARCIQSFQRSKSISGPPRSLGDPCLTSGYISDESDDSSFSLFSMDDSLFLNDDMESDGKVYRPQTFLPHRAQSGVKLTYEFIRSAVEFQHRQQMSMLHVEVELY